MPSPEAFLSPGDTLPWPKKTKKHPIISKNSLKGAALIPRNNLTTRRQIHEKKKQKKTHLASIHTRGLQATLLHCRPQDFWIEMPLEKSNRMRPMQKNILSAPPAKCATFVVFLVLEKFPDSKQNPFMGAVASGTC